MESALGPVPGAPKSLATEKARHSPRVSAFAGDDQNRVGEKARRLRLAAARVSKRNENTAPAVGLAPFPTMGVPCPMNSVDGTFLPMMRSRGSRGPYENALDGSYKAFSVQY